MPAYPWEKSYQTGPKTEFSPGTPEENLPIIQLITKKNQKIKLTLNPNPTPKPSTSVIQYRHTTVKISLQSEASLKKLSSLLRAPKSSIVSYLHEWETTAMFELGTADSVQNRMGEEIWGIEVFFDL